MNDGNVDNKSTKENFTCEKDRATIPEIVVDRYTLTVYAWNEKKEENLGNCLVSSFGPANPKWTCEEFCNHVRDNHTRDWERDKMIVKLYPITLGVMIPGRN